MEVTESAGGQPLKIRLGQSRYIGITSVEDMWRIDDEWWREDPVSRLYYEVIIPMHRDGRRMTIFKDLLRSTWYRQNYT
ncbi:MAG: hypothetical protein HY671_02685 [Chloroflexi bacterium]|nr:hypothetical protein [Chloroflexota bacterium]